MPPTSQKTRDERRALLAFLLAQGFRSKAELARALDVSRHTVYADLKALEKEGRPKAPEDVAIMVRGVARKVQDVYLDILDDKKASPKTRMAAAGSLWGVFKSRIHLEQAIGLMPKEPEKIEVSVEMGEAIKALFKAISARMPEASARDMAKAMRSTNAEDPELLERMGLRR